MTRLVIKILEHAKIPHYLLPLTLPSSHFCPLPYLILSFQSCLLFIHSHLFLATLAAHSALYDMQIPGFPLTFSFLNFNIQFFPHLQPPHLSLLLLFFQSFLSNDNQTTHSQKNSSLSLPISPQFNPRHITTLKPCLPTPVTICFKKQNKNIDQCNKNGREDWTKNYFFKQSK